MIRTCLTKLRLPALALSTILVSGILAIAGPALAEMSRPDPQAIARRQALLHITGPAAEAVAQLTKALRDPDPLVARTAARLLGRYGEAALPALGRALQSRDVQVRRAACAGLGEVGPAAVEALAGALSDDSPYVRQAAVLALARIRPSSARTIGLLTDAGKDSDPLVSGAALQAIKFAFTVLDSIRLPREGWKFRTDPERVGEDNKWFAADFDDAAWADIEIEKAWTEQGYDYIGWSWYRRTLELPAREDRARAEMAFEGVDESAWVWINGQYVGAHDIGATGWDKPFRLDVTDALKWGEPNQITVRAMNTAMAGGIWRPVHILVLEPAR